MGALTKTVNVTQYKLRYRNIRDSFFCKTLAFYRTQCMVVHKTPKLALKLRTLNSIMRIINNNETKMSFKKIFIEELNEF